MKRTRFAMLFTVLLLPAAVFAQGSGSTGGRPTDVGPSPFEVTRTIKGSIVAIEGDTAVIEDNKGQRTTFKVNSETNFRADKKTELHGKNHISLADFWAGAVIEVKFRASDTFVREVRLKHVKNKEQKSPTEGTGI
ncbi:MAG: hypothetical protein L0387_36365 [Acidobacteria bacterium]|nr:hypothetical protein [Acidobacteriota bacterium]